MSSGITELVFCAPVVIFQGCADGSYIGFHVEADRPGSVAEAIRAGVKEGAFSPSEVERFVRSYPVVTRLGRSLRLDTRAAQYFLSSPFYPFVTSSFLWRGEKLGLVQRRFGSGRRTGYVGAFGRIFSRTEGISGEAKGFFFAESFAAVDECRLEYHVDEGIDPVSREWVESASLATFFVQSADGVWKVRAAGLEEWVTLDEYLRRCTSLF